MVFLTVDSVELYRLYDWASMERRITEGRCPRLKQAAAEGVTMETLMIQIAADEVVSPPPPPVGSLADDGADGDIPPELLRCPLSAVPGHRLFVRQYARQCLLCGQRLKDAGHVKNHWRTIHTSAWNATHQDAFTAAQSLRATFVRPCAYCRSKAQLGSYNANHHATKCSPLFHVLAARRLHQDGVLEQHRQALRGLALKQREKRNSTSR